MSCTLAVRHNAAAGTQDDQSQNAYSKRMASWRLGCAGGVWHDVLAWMRSGGDGGVEVGVGVGTGREARPTAWLILTLAFA
jgi:hypothetical protein